ncbi:MAG TPA: CHC2 zinc finger domain-containing protein [Mycobacteriales bacterium]|nr:CHC2 zinc finger domain-containing protein [Mycobacteriales bacterium]
MARVPEAEIEQLKERVSLASLVEARGIELRRVGKDLVGCCPFHDDRDPSLVVTPGKNLWHCMGACSTGGSVIDWVMRVEGVSFRHAVELLRDGTITTKAAGPAPKRSTVRKLPTPVQQSAGDAELLGQVVDYYHRVLLESGEALEYLRRRRIDHPDALSTFRFGYANRTLGLRLPDKRRAAGSPSWGSSDRRGMSILPGRWWSRSPTTPVSSRSSMAGRSGTICGRGRRRICICRGRTAGCSTSKRSPPATS